MFFAMSTGQLKPVLGAWCARWPWLWAVLVAGSALVLGACGWWNLTTRTPPLVESRKAPSFTLPDENGQSVSLAELLEHGPAVVVFYRGHW